MPQISRQGRKSANWKSSTYGLGDGRECAHHPGCRGNASEKETFSSSSFFSSNSSCSTIHNSLGHTAHNIGARVGWDDGFRCIKSVNRDEHQQVGNRVTDGLGDEREWTHHPDSRGSASEKDTFSSSNFFSSNFSCSTIRSNVWHTTQYRGALGVG